MNEDRDASVLQRIERCGVIPVVMPPKASLAGDLGDALAAEALGPL